MGLLSFLALTLLASPSAAAPDANAFSNGSRIYTVRLDGSDARELSALFGWGNEAPVWSPDGRRIAFLVGSLGERRVYRRLFVMRADGSGKRRLSPRSMVAGREGDPPSWAPDGSQIAFSAVAAPHRAGIWAVGLRGGPRLVARAGFEPAWSPDGRRIAYRTRAPRSSLRTVAPAGGPSSLIVQGAFSPAWSPDAKRIAYTSTSGRSLLLVRLATGERERLLRASAELGAPEWSPDGKKILITDWRPRIFVVEPARHRVVGLGTGYSPRWSPDGRLIAFGFALSGGDAGLYVMRADGSNRRLVWSAAGWAVGSIAWSPRGDRLLFDAAPTQ